MAACVRHCIQQDTIFALSTAVGKAGLAVVRIAGPRSLQILKKLSDARIEPRKATWTILRHPWTREHLDDGIFVYYKGPKSFTGTDTVELNLHGAGPTVRAILEAIAACDDGGAKARHGSLRHAEPGEFARMAFENGRMDLTALEGLSALLNAQTDAQRKLALSQSGGSLKRIFDGWRFDLTRILASMEAVIDFGDDEEIIDHDRGIKMLGDLVIAMERFLEDGRRGEVLTRGIKMTIFGPPNAGKSSLLNKLVRRKASITSSEPGTTRDVVQVTLDIGGYPVLVGDTAGIRSGSEVGRVEFEGVELAKERIAASDLKLLVLDGLEAGEAAEFIDDTTLILLNKIDIRPLKSEQVSEFARAIGRNAENNSIWPLSLHNGQGYQDFLDDLEDYLKTKYGMDTLELGEGGILTQARHRLHIETSLSHLREACFLSGKKSELVLIAEEVRMAIRSLEAVVGRVDVEEVLDSLFATFCIGK